MDRAVLESDPFRVIEGLTIAAYAVGRVRGHRLRPQRVPDRRAPRARGHRDGRSARVPRRSHSRVARSASRCTCAKGAGAFVCGEETALIQSIEGERGMPRLRPPYPAESGLWGKPTLINNVETLACLPWIFRRGPEAFAAMGTASSKGTKVFSLTGKVKRGGLIEVPMGITIREIVEDIGGGMKDGRRFKAVLAGGPSGGCIPAQPGRHAHRLRGAGVDRRHHGIGRPGGARRSRLRGGDRPLLPALHAERVVRQVHVLPRRHEADAGDPRAHLRRHAAWTAISRCSTS